MKRALTHPLKRVPPPWQTSSFSCEGQRQSEVNLTEEFPLTSVCFESELFSGAHKNQE